MATATLAALVNREAMGKALALARVECKDDQRWLNAVNRAALNLEACQWQFDGETLLVKSATDDMHYTVTTDGCECKAFLSGKPCWHRAARRLLMKAAEIAQQPEPVETCPMCGKPIVGRAYTVNGKAFVYFEVCDGDGVHLISHTVGGDL